jgi:hypothetical protein
MCLYLDEHSSVNLMNAPTLARVFAPYLASASASVEQCAVLWESMLNDRKNVC